MRLPVVIAWLSPSLDREELRKVLQEELRGSHLRFFSQEREAQAYREQGILEGEEIFLFLAPLPEGSHFLEESISRWPLAYGLGLSQDDNIVLADTKYPVVSLNGHGYLALRFHLRGIYQRYEERRRHERKQQILTELHRVSLSLTGEVRLEWLIFKVLRLAIDNSGAERGFLIVPDPPESHQLRVVGYAEAGDHEPRPYPPQPAEAEPQIFHALLQHATRARENIFVTEADTDSLWTSHPDWEKLGVYSILCLPLVYQGKLIGIVYLSHASQSLLAEPAQAEFLKLFTAPAAVALQNAQLYAEMEERVRERTEEVIRQKEEIERQSLLLRQQNEDILASLRYAQRVQRAIFPPWSELQRTFPESFLFYQPREIVGGDFYWYTQRLSKVIIAVGDCTGHGIPGAFMTIIANTLLKQIVELEGVFKPSEILYLLNLRMRAALQHEEVIYQRFQEGMEIALIQVDPRRHKLLYAGAGRPLFLARQSKGIEVRPDRITIGAPYEGEAPEFSLHHIDLMPNDMIYLFSDGFTDQLNGEGKRYQLRRLYEFFELVAEQPARQQGLLLEAEYNRWVGNARQTDDILILGIRIP
ncbi:MAG: SpoIIE family protein phosphatase [Bacteroidia bacterium]|nr:SpoIIE family protein phosphatase [Bacteroidia bacterium]MDW8134207.1 SpoIIE family protein phosphatase [Bacteroidia bacterium]